MNDIGQRENKLPDPESISLTPAVGVDGVRLKDGSELRFEEKLVLHSDFERLRREIEVELTAIKRDLDNLNLQIAST